MHKKNIPTILDKIHKYFSIVVILNSKDIELFYFKFILINLIKANFLIINFYLFKNFLMKNTVLIHRKTNIFNLSLYEILFDKNSILLFY